MTKRDKIKIMKEFGFGWGKIKVIRSDGKYYYYDYNNKKHSLSDTLLDFIVAWYLLDKEGENNVR